MESTETQTKVLVASGNKVFCESLCHLLSHHKPDCLCLTIFQKGIPRPDIIIVESTQSLELLQKKYPEAKVIFMDTGLCEQEIMYVLLSHRVDGVIPTDTSMELFLKALDVVLAGQIWIENKHLKALLRSRDSLAASGGIKSLSPQDRKIVRFVAKGLKNREIAEQLHLSEHTIKAHNSRIFRKLGVKRRAQLISLALENNLHLESNVEC